MSLMCTAADASACWFVLRRMTKRLVRGTQECGKDVAMQIAALNAAYLDKGVVPADAMEKRRNPHRADQK